MKNLLFYCLLFAACFLQSCSVISEITYFKDATSTSLVDIDAKQTLSMVKAFAIDSSGEKGSLEELEKLPKTWTSFYEIQKKDGSLPKNPDSIKLLKRAFMKSNFENDELSGFSLKLERFSAQDYKNFDKMNEGKREKIQLEKQMFTDWDGKKLTIDINDLNFDNMDELLKEKEEDENLSSEEIKQKKEQVKAMMQMFDMKMMTTLKFENKIKNISGKHEWFQKIDDHSVKINFDFKKMFDEKPSDNSTDKGKIIITTE